MCSNTILELVNQEKERVKKMIKDGTFKESDLKIMKDNLELIVINIKNVMREIGWRYF